jgi:regulation of enolase protein 1 (concanavalin A-like superfamily)
MEFQWMNESEIRTDGKWIEIMATPQSDFFCNSGSVSEEGITPESLNNAPYYYTEMEGDFVLQVKVSHEFRDTYEAASVMVMADLKNWAKACYEMTVFGTHAAVSVVTKGGESDDANGCNLEGNTAWLRVCRVDNTFSFHYSTDGEHFYMMRFFSLPAGKSVRVGLLAQAPVGDGGVRVYEDLTLESRTVKNIRFGE